MLVKNCNDVLQDLNKLLIKYKSLGTASKRKWDRLKWGTENMQGIQERLMSQRSTLTLFLTTLGTGSLGRIEKKLDQLIEDVRAGRREETVLTMAIGDDDEDESDVQWNILKAELFDDGLTKVEIEGHKHWIKAKLAELAENGGLHEQPPLEKASSSAATQEAPLSKDSLNKVGAEEIEAVDTLNAHSAVPRKSPISSVPSKKIAALQPTVEDAEGDDDEIETETQAALDRKEAELDVVVEEEFEESEGDEAAEDDDASDASDTTDDSFQATVLPTDSISQVGLSAAVESQDGEPSRSGKPVKNQKGIATLPDRSQNPQQQPNNQNVPRIFTPKDWENKFEAGNGDFRPKQNAANMPHHKRTKPTRRSRGRSPGPTRPIDPQYAKPPAEEQTPIESTKFTAKEWAQIKPQTFMTPSTPNTQPAMPTSPTGARKVHGPSLRPAMGTAAVVDYIETSDEEPLYTSRKSAGSSSRQHHRQAPEPPPHYVIRNGQSIPIQNNPPDRSYLCDPLSDRSETPQRARERVSLPGKHRSGSMARHPEQEPPMYKPGDTETTGRPGGSTDPYIARSRPWEPTTLPNLRDYYSFSNEGAEAGATRSGPTPASGGILSGFENEKAGQEGGFSFSNPDSIFSEFLRQGGMGGGDEGFEDLFGKPSQRPRSVRPKTPEVTTVERPIPLTLEELFGGCHKEFKIRRKTYDETTGKRTTEDKRLEFDVKPGLRTGSKIKFKGVGNQEPGVLQDLHFIIEEVSSSNLFQ